jgi:hypothetical protein
MAPGALHWLGFPGPLGGMRMSHGECRTGVRLAAFFAMLAVVGLSGSATAVAESGSPSDDVTCVTFFPSAPVTGSLTPTATETAAPSAGPSATSQLSGAPTGMSSEPTATVTDVASDTAQPTDVLSDTDQPTDGPSQPSQPTDAPTGPATACVAGAAASAGGGTRRTSAAADPLAHSGSDSAQLVALAGLVLVAGIGLSVVGARRATRRGH